MVDTPPHDTDGGEIHHVAAFDRNGDSTRAVSGDHRDRAAEHADTQDHPVEVVRARARRDRTNSSSDRHRASEDRAAADSDRTAAAEDRRRSAIDHLTGTYTRAAGIIELEHDFADSKHNSRLSMIVGFLDVDALKTINDAHGHNVGDAVLRTVADVVRARLRPLDILIRYGGDEFVFATVGLSLKQVRSRIADIDTDLHTATTAVPLSAPLTITCGLADAAGAASLAEVIEQADADLYRRRTRGRARTSSTAASTDDSSAVTPDNNSRLDNLIPRVTAPPERAHAIAQQGLNTDRGLNAGGQPDAHAVLTDLGSVRPIFQPIVELSTSRLVGYEALARWPHAPAVDPVAVFAAAHRTGRLADANWICALAAIDGALTAGITGEHLLFVNVEPRATHAAGPAIPEHARELIDSATERLRVVVELTERSLLIDPAWLLDLVQQARAHGALIALDDVGAHPDSLTLLEFIAPDIIKLDRPLIQSALTPGSSGVVAAVDAHAEATGAIILAEGIETRAHLRQARALGATYGQGWLYGHPAPLPFSAAAGAGVSVTSDLQAGDSALLPVVQEVLSVPSDVFAFTEPRVGRKELILALTRQIEEHARTLSEPLTILASFQHARWFTPAVAERYAHLAAENPFVAALGIAMLPEPALGVRGAHLEPGEDFTDEWTITVVGPHYFAALIAREAGTDSFGACIDADREFRFVHTHDRVTVVAAARSLMHRVLPTTA